MPNASRKRSLRLRRLEAWLPHIFKKMDRTRFLAAAVRGLADCYYNLALLYEELKKPKKAIQHMAQ
jgi:hypothetical protein